MMNILKQYIERLMKDSENGFLAGIWKFFLLAISCVYGLVVKLHDIFYKLGILKSYKPQSRVISVGNITLGGTGKTPLVIMLAKYIKNTGKNVGILIRGYGEDEWKLLEKNTKAKVFVGKNRVKSAKLAEKENIDSIILDDGFQHRPVKRDADIVLIDATNPFGNGHLFPRGILREPIANLKRANLFVLTKADKGKDDIASLEKKIKELAPNTDIIHASHKPVGLYDIANDSEVSIDFIKDKDVSILSAICDESYFKYTVSKIARNVKNEFIFQDHHLYKQSDVDCIARKCKGSNIIITTEKDAVKLKNLNLPKDTISILALKVDFEVINGVEKLYALCN